MSALRSSVVLLLVCVLLGCGKPSGVTPPPDDNDPPPPPVINGTVSVVVPVGMVPGFEYTWVATWEDGTAPFSIAWDFGGGAENIAAETATSPASASVTVASEPLISYTYLVVVTDAEGQENQGTGTYDVGETPTDIPIIDDGGGDDGGGDDGGGGDGGGDDDPDPIPNIAPTIESVEEELGTVIVSVNDSDDAVVAVYVSEVPGMLVDLEPQMVAVPGTAVFQFTADQYYFVDSGTTTVTVNDGNEGIVTQDVTVSPVIPAEYILTAEYDRASRMLTINRDFSNRQLVELKFLGPEWIAVVGGNTQMVPGEWSAMAFELELAEDDSNVTDLVITAQTFLRPFDPMPNSPVYETTVHVTRPLYISTMEYDYDNEKYRVEVNPLEGAELGFETTYTNDITGTELLQDVDNPNRYTAQVDYSASTIKYGYAEVTVSDQFGNADTDRVFLQHESVALVDDRLYAYFDRDKALVGEEVMITAVTGKLSNPFHFMIGAGLVMEDDVEYVSASFNLGSPGGAKEFADGVWADVAPDSFLLMPDSLYVPGRDPEETLEGKLRIDINITPMDGDAILGAVGDLFNIRVTYSEPGLKTLGFQEINGVYRSYYGDWDANDYVWGDISNWHPGLQTTVLVD